MGALNRSFRFVDGRRQGDLLALVRDRGAPHAVDGDGALRYASADDEWIENELICLVRSRLFPEWHVFTLEGDETARPQTTARYRAYMVEHGIPFAEEVADGFVWFLVPQEHDSFKWDVPDGDEAKLGVVPDCGS